MARERIKIVTLNIATIMYYMTMVALKISRVQEAFVAQLMQVRQGWAEDNIVSTKN